MRFCGGWLGWTSQQTLNEDLVYIAAAYEGFGETMEAIFGSKKDDLPPVSKGADGKPIKFTPNVFDVQFGMNDNVPQIRRK